MAVKGKGRFLSRTRTKVHMAAAEIKYSEKFSNGRK